MAELTDRPMMPRQIAARFLTDRDPAAVREECKKYPEPESAHKWVRMYVEQHNGRKKA